MMKREGESKIAKTTYILDLERLFETYHKLSSSILKIAPTNLSRSR
jgi:hypothetical protein